jgi:dTDP-4-dehydrorhamnose reductase
MKVLILGAGGMLGHTMLRVLQRVPGMETRGTVRSRCACDRLGPRLASLVTAGIDAVDQDCLADVVGRERPDVVVNCIGLVKQRDSATDPLQALPVNALLPHRIARLCLLMGARLVHFSTDCVFDGRRGRYTESDSATATDLYGRSKLLGEVDAPHAVTLRTSMIGPELTTHRGLLDWFLAQRAPVKGFRRAIFSGLTTVELANVVRDRVLPRPELRGVYHVAADAISKFDLLTLVGRIYCHDVAIEPDDALVLDRSLDGTRFRAATGYVAPPWTQMITEMRDVSHDD